jgi:hypothetical protein
VARKRAAKKKKARENRAFIRSGQQFGTRLGKWLGEKDLAKKRPRMGGARSSGVTGTPWPQFAPVFTGATALWRSAVTPI